MGWIVGLKSPTSTESRNSVNKGHEGASIRYLNLQSSELETILWFIRSRAQPGIAVGFAGNPLTKLGSGRRLPSFCVRGFVPQLELWAGVGGTWKSSILVWPLSCRWKTEQTGTAPSTLAEHSHPSGRRATPGAGFRCGMEVGYHGYDRPGFHRKLCPIAARLRVKKVWFRRRLPSTMWPARSPIARASTFPGSPKSSPCLILFSRQTSQRVSETSRGGVQTRFLRAVEDVSVMGLLRRKLSFSMH